MMPAFWLATLPLLSGAEPAAKSYVLEVKDAKRVEATLTYGVHYDQMQAKEWIIVAAKAPELPGQIKVTTKTSLKSEVLSVGPAELKRSIVRARLPVKGADLEKGFEWTVTYEATLRSRRLKPLESGDKPNVPDLPERERKAYLTPAGDMNYEAEGFRAWLRDNNLTREEGESEIEYARRAFLALRGKLKYKFGGEMDRTCGVTRKSGESDCGGMAALFAGVMRAEGVPARILCGRWAASMESDNDHRLHVKAEFFARGVGWVPADLAAGNVWDKSKEGLKYFGNDDGDFVCIHVDDRFEIDSVHFGKQKLHNLQIPSCWATGKSPAEGSKPKMKDEWKVKEVK
jgi:hypothetical protein